MGKEIIDALSRQDPVMYKLIEEHGELKLHESRDYFVNLASSIIGQQLSNKVADTIWGRLVALLKNEVTPSKIILTEDEAFRQCGVSDSKTKYIKNLAQAVMEKTLDLENISKLTNDKVIEQLTKIKGIGRWTAEMFLIFSLAREDVFSLGDGGLYGAMKKLYGNGENLSKTQILEISEQWAPYRSYASLYLWKSLDV